jgi:predicted Zn-dependent protease
LAEAIATPARSLDEVVEVLGGSAFVEAISERQELLRFGASRVTYQHSEERLTVRIKLVRDGRAAWATLGSLDLAELAAMRARLEAALTQLPPGDACLPAWGSEVRAVKARFPATEAMTASDRAETFRRVVAGLPAEAEAGGSIATSVVRHALGTSTGLQREEQRTRALVQVIANRAAHSAYARALHRDASALDTDTLVAGLNEWLAPLPLRPLVPGTYRAVLQPPAVITLLASLGQLAFNARTYRDGESIFSGKLQQRVLSPALTLCDDGADPRGLPTSFDCLGTPKQRVQLLADGVLTGQVSNSTGHAAPLGWRFGADPCPSHLVLEPGALSELELLQACGSGLSIQRVDYVRVVHARETMVTGTTRDATCWIENGRVVARVPQFRFTLRLTDLFNSVEALGAQLERGEMVFMESVATPAMVVREFPVGSVVAA